MQQSDGEAQAKGAEFPSSGSSAPVVAEQRTLMTAEHYANVVTAAESMRALYYNTTLPLLRLEGTSQCDIYREWFAMEVCLGRLCAPPDPNRPSHYPDISPEDLLLWHSGPLLRKRKDFRQYAEEKGCQDLGDDKLWLTVTFNCFTYLVPLTIIVAHKARRKAQAKAAKISIAVTKQKAEIDIRVAAVMNKVTEILMY